jgi:hypothetical protein
MKEKIFRDTVHGDILVPIEFCENFIDTLLFQRLRRIEQTSMRSLYPCARHDRFIHSLGVFHLGRNFIQNIAINSKKNNNDSWLKIESDWQIVEKSFQIACLLHDIGHAPFSHTFEEYFDVIKEKKLEKQLIETVDDESFEKDIRVYPDSKPHEKTSALIVLRVFKQAINNNLGGNVNFVIRMILGVKYRDPSNMLEKVVNCIIPLLHGSVDVDRIDYACRDQWASGFSSARINVNRIINSGLLVFSEDSVTFCYYKSAINQFQSLIDIKYYQKTWVFNHHKVQYDQYLLKRAIEKVAELIANQGQSKEDVLNKLFDVDIFFNEDYSVNGYNIYLLSDDDLISLMKKFIGKNDFAKQWLSRSHRFKPLWKSETEYVSYFENANKITLDRLKLALQDLFDRSDDKYVIIEPKRSNDRILKNDVSLYVNDTIIDYTKLNFNKNTNVEIDSYFYIYIDDQHFINKEDIVNKIRSFS